MICLGVVRRPPTAADDRDLQRRVLDLALESHPVPLAFAAIPVASPRGPGELPEALALIRAVRDLVLAGLLASDGLRVVPTAAALHYRDLERADG
ncbi:MAG TPA: hypothetical protein VFI09_09670 [Solirubrobacterales bacterium]|nr:hypothetical protein [Solirubrobacterales bacterium]